MALILAVIAVWAPVWRLFLPLYVALLFFTWAYAWRSRRLTSVVTTIKQAEVLNGMLDQSYRDNEELNEALEGLLETLEAHLRKKISAEDEPLTSSDT